MSAHGRQRVNHRCSTQAIRGETCPSCDDETLEGVVQEGRSVDGVRCTRGCELRRFPALYELAEERIRDAAEAERHEVEVGDA